MVDLLPGDIDILFCITFCILSPLSIKKYVLQQWGLNLLKYRLPQLKSTSDLPIFHFYAFLTFDFVLKILFFKEHINNLIKSSKVYSVFLTFSVQLYVVNKIPPAPWLTNWVSDWNQKRKNLLLSNEIFMTVILNELRQKTIARDVESDYTRSYRSFAPQTDFSKRVIANDEKITKLRFMTLGWGECNIVCPLSTVHLFKIELCYWEMKGRISHNL